MSVSSALGPEYRKLWAASAVSNLGDGITLVAGPLLAATLTRDPVLVAGITFAQRLPLLLIGVSIFLVALAFSFTALGKAERYLPSRQTHEDELAAEPSP